MDAEQKTVIVSVIQAVAKELAEQAKAAMPPLADGEEIIAESYKDGFYTRNTTSGTFVYSFHDRTLLEGGGNDG